MPLVSEILQQFFICYCLATLVLVAKATKKLIDHIDTLDAIYERKKRAGLRKPPYHKTVEAASTGKSPATDR